MSAKFDWPERLLMVRPNGYRVEYAINPYMLDSQGNLQTVDSSRAAQQWHDLKKTYEQLGLSVEVLEGDPAFPDMVYAANQTLPLWDRFGKPQLLLSRMHSRERRGEVRHFQAWAEAQGLSWMAMTDYDFEGSGDALWNYETRELFGGYGFRTHEGAYDLIAQLTGAKIYKLRLVSEHFYHMDTALAILNAETAAYVPEAFASESRAVLQSKFKTLIEVDVHEAKTFFATNCVSVDGKHVVVQKGATRFIQALSQRGFVPVLVETSEFIKSGGSAFCMKQFLH